MDAGAVDVRVVGREPELAVAVDPEVLLGDHRRVPEDRLGDGDVVDDVLVGVGEIARGRNEEQGLRGRRAARRQDEERIQSSDSPWRSRSADARAKVVGHTPTTSVSQRQSSRSAIRWSSRRQRIADLDDCRWEPTPRGRCRPARAAGVRAAADGRPERRGPHPVLRAAGEADGKILFLAPTRTWPTRTR